MNMIDVKAALTPNSKVVMAIVDRMDAFTNGQFKKDIIKAGMNELDTALFIVKFTVGNNMMEMEECWNLVFGEGSYASLKKSVYELLK